MKITLLPRRLATSRAQRTSLLHWAKQTSKRVKGKPMNDGTTGGRADGRTDGWILWDEVTSANFEASDRKAKQRWMMRMDTYGWCSLSTSVHSSTRQGQNTWIPLSHSARGDFWGITGQNPTLSKPSQLHVQVILRFFFIEVRYILYRTSMASSAKK